MRKGNWLCALDVNNKQQHSCAMESTLDVNMLQQFAYAKDYNGRKQLATISLL